ncbi:hypothetical protein [Thomasclavelia cocleata]|uniref:hypothetical protein n=1 Tax=Thomasclavelia cocleata TaxID=69824 RepID=UPI00242FB993|nr:hypothetical protein [Thomasclavelia cocleata]
MKRTAVIATILCSGLLLGGNVCSNVFAQQNEIAKQTNAVQEVKSLTKNDALNLLLNHNDLVYLYQGDENTFEILKEKGLSGYVFLPNIETDIGYFVDKGTKEIYYFHPSGYLELVK